MNKDEKILNVLNQSHKYYFGNTDIKVNNDSQLNITDSDIILYRIDEITYEEKGKYKFLTIVLDKVGGIDLDLIVEATHIINPIVDEFNLPIEDYILDVISKERG